MIHYQEIHKDKVEYELQQRYKDELHQLHQLGFDELHHTREVSFPFSVIPLFYVYPLLKSSREVFRIVFPLRYVLLNPLVLNREYDSYALISGIGIKIATLFTDETLLYSANYPTPTIVKPERKIYRYGTHVTKAPIEKTWIEHQQHIFDLEASGLETDSDLTLLKFEQAMRRDDKALIFGR